MIVDIGMGRGYEECHRHLGKELGQGHGACVIVTQEISYVEHLGSRIAGTRIFVLLHRMYWLLFTSPKTTIEAREGSWTQVCMYSTVGNTRTSLFITMRWVECFIVIDNFSLSISFRSTLPSTRLDLLHIFRLNSSSQLLFHSCPSPMSCCLRRAFCITLTYDQLSPSIPP
jgi:hypothetical protein